MRKLVCAAVFLAPLVGGVGLVGADDALESTESVNVEAESYAPGKIEAGIFFGGFISNFYHQFYDDELFDANEGGTNTREELNRVSPELGARFAVFPHENIGVEAEASAVLAQTKMSSSGVQIYGLGVQGILQKPGRFTPYLGLGFGLRATSSDMLGSDIDVPLHASAGFRLWLSRSVALRADLRFIRGPSEGHPQADPSWTLNASYGEFSLGVSFNPMPRGGDRTPPPVDHDPDRDGVLDSADMCPNEAGAGNPDGCPTKDSDGDGIADKEDKCPDQAETVNKWDDQDGCPDTVPDTDGDGMDDLADKCVDQAEDVDAFQDEDGCPDPDNDNDGVLDGKDKCPGVTGPVDNWGCPDTDQDADGIVDRLDNCPAEKGTEKNHGCKAKQLVVITKDRLQILDQVKFVTGSTKLSGASNKLLDNIARVLIAHPEIWKVKVEGHTDNVGKPEKNQTLSDGRAASVVKYLVKKGVQPERLEAVGHGDTAPIEDNKTAKGRAQNRRVEFNIVNE